MTFDLTGAQRAGITAIVAAHARDVDDELELLQMLGAIEAPPHRGYQAPTPADRLDQQREYQIRRRDRQLACMDRGLHPLSASRTMPDIPLHPDAPAPGDLTAPGPRCGACLHRRQVARSASFSGCFQHAPTAVYCMASWPACRDYEPRNSTPTDHHAITVDDGPYGWVATCSCGRYTSDPQPTQGTAGRCGRTHLNALNRARPNPTTNQRIVAPEG